jgi:hypothetical protein
MRAFGTTRGRPRGAALALALAVTLEITLATIGCAPLGVFRPGSEDDPEIVSVTMTDTSIDVSPSLVGRGKIGLDIRNDGQLEHAYRLVGPGADEGSDEFLTTGQHRLVSVKLEPGTFRLYCPDGDHAARGMSARLVVTERVGWFRR